MATESSRATAFRALVMLSCLITIPAVAISGKSLPDMFQGLIPQGWQRQTASSPEELPERVTWRVTPDAAAVDPLDADAKTGALVAPSWPGARKSAAASPVQSPAADGVGPPAGPVFAGHEIPADRSGLREAASMVPARRPPRIFAAEPLADSPLEPPDRFTQTEQRLRQLGATYYMLESWGQGEQLFRFCCRVAVSGSPNYTRYFEATNAVPLLAMSEVLAEVEAWRAGR